MTGKKNYIHHLESLVSSTGFIGRAVTSYSAFVAEINRLYAARGSSIIVPVDAAVTQFREKLREKMDSFVADQIQADLVATRQKKITASDDMRAEERIMDGSHDGTNIAQIASKAAKTELIQTQQQLKAALRGIQDLQEKYNELDSSRIRSVPPLPESAASKGQKRKSDHSLAADHPESTQVQDLAPTPIRRVQCDRPR